VLLSEPINYSSPPWREAPGRWLYPCSLDVTPVFTLESGAMIKGVPV